MGEGGGGEEKGSFFPSPLFLFRFHFSRFPQKRLILRLHWQGIANKLNKVWKEGSPASFSRESRIPRFCVGYPEYRFLPTIRAQKRQTVPLLG